MPKFKIYSEESFLVELYQSLTSGNKQVCEFAEKPSKTADSDVEALQAVYGFDLSALMDIGIGMYEFLAYIATSEPVATASFIYTVFGLISKFRSAERGEYHNILYIFHESGRSHVISVGSDFDEEEAKEALESFLIRLEGDE